MSDEMKIRLKEREAIINRLSSLRRQMEPDSPAVRAALTKVALLIVSQAKINARRKQITDTGRLLNSLRFEFVRPAEAGGGIRVQIGSFGIPYAAMHEFGGVYPRGQMRAMFATLRERGKLTPSGGGKGVMKGNVLRARPYLRPAYLLHKDRVIGLIKDSLEKGE